ncbi:hypothetical protein GMMP15_660082 [Candidatus Magnetomoraceae bacterium gMMP-15]
MQAMKNYYQCMQIAQQNIPTNWSEMASQTHNKQEVNEKRDRFVLTQIYVL